MLQVRLLGQVDAWGESRLLTGRARPQERAVLAVLVERANHSVSVAALLEEVWGPSRSERSQRTLQCHISRLRCRLKGYGEVVRGSSSYQLRCIQTDIDARDFSDLIRHAAHLTAPERLQVLDKALCLWRGEPLQGLDVPYAVRRRAQLRRLHLRAVLQWSDAALATGMASQAIEALEELWERDPSCEPIAARLMACLYRTGYTADALRCFDRLRNHLDEELGQLPGPEVEAIHLGILRHQPLPAELKLGI